jgi:hypothetical protein
VEQSKKTHFTEGSFAKGFEWTVRNVVLALVALIGLGASLWVPFGSAGEDVEEETETTEEAAFEPDTPAVSDDEATIEDSEEASEEEQEEESESAASTTTLDRLEPVEGAGSTQTGTVEVNGGSYANSVYWGLGANSTTVTYQLSRQYSQLTAIGGITDDSGTSADTVIRFYDDDEVLIAEYELQLAMQADIDVPLDGVHRLRMELSPSGFGNSDLGHAALGTATLWTGEGGAPPQPSEESESAVSTTTLDRLEPVEGARSTQTGTVEVNGGSYANSVYWGLGGNSTTVTYQLSRQYSQLTAIGGITDDSGTSADTVIRFYDDDEVLIAEYELQLAMQADIDVPLDGVHRLRMELSPSGFGNSDLGHAALGAARLD